MLYRSEPLDALTLRVVDDAKGDIVDAETTVRSAIVVEGYGKVAGAKTANNSVVFLRTLGRYKDNVHHLVEVGVEKLYRLDARLTLGVDEDECHQLLLGILQFRSILRRHTYLGNALAKTDALCRNIYRGAENTEEYGYEESHTCSCDVGLLCEGSDFSPNTKLWVCFFLRRALNFYGDYCREV